MTAAECFFFAEQENAKWNTQRSLPLIVCFWFEVEDANENTKPNMQLSVLLINSKVEGENTTKCAALITADYHFYSYYGVVVAVVVVVVVVVVIVLLMLHATSRQAAHR